MKDRKIRLYCLTITLIIAQIPLFGQKIDPGDDDISKLWYKSAIIYNLEITTFKDSDGDGVGDLKGLIQKLDYLQALGVDAIWLSPFQPSPGLDDGYDVADHYGINKRYGSPGDFSELMYEVEKRGLRLMTDLVLNHTSVDHEWFQKARKDENSPYRNWYLWSEELPDDADQGMVFPGQQESTWTFDKVAGLYYYHRFYNFQPDLNYSLPAVREEAKKILGYWIRQGIVGFRLDAVPFILEQSTSHSSPPDHDFEYLYSLRRSMQWRRGEAIILGEANVTPEETLNYFGERGEGIHMMFNFHTNQRLFLSLATEEASHVLEALQETQNIPAVSQWANFLRNHDELDLGRLSDEERQVVFERFAPDSTMQLYGRGIKRRLPPMLENEAQLKMAYSLMFALPGTPVFRYGDEIGMGDLLWLPERISVRTPMQWTSEANAGFTDAETPFRPVISHGKYRYQEVNVADQLRNPDSFLNWIKKIIALRKGNPEIGLGKWEIIDTDERGVIVLKYTHAGNSVVVLHNLGAQDAQVRLDTSMEGDEIWYDQIGNSDLRGHNGEIGLTLEGYGYKWYRLGAPML